MPITAKLVVSSEWNQDERFLLKQVLKLEKERLENLLRTFRRGSVFYQQICSRSWLVHLLYRLVSDEFKTEFLERHRHLFSEFITDASS